MSLSTGAQKPEAWCILRVGLLLGDCRQHWPVRDVDAYAIAVCLDSGPAAAWRTFQRWHGLDGCPRFHVSV